MSEPFIFDPDKLKGILDAVGFDKAIAAVLNGVVESLPLDGDTKAALEGKVTVAVNALINQLGPAILDKLKDQVAADLLKAVATGRGPISDDPSGYA